MSVLNQVRLVVYRYHEKGLEFLLINPELAKDPSVWKLPEGEYNSLQKQQNFIELDPQLDDHGNQYKTLAIEADWHEIPSIRGIIKHDVKRVKNKIKETVPELEKGSYFVAKEAFKKVLPNEYRTLKEIKDILLDRNILMNI